MVAVLIRPVDVETKGGPITIDAIVLAKDGFPFMGPHPIFKNRRAFWDDKGVFRSGGAADGRYDLSGTADTDKALSELLHAWQALAGLTERSA